MISALLVAALAQASTPDPAPKPKLEPEVACVARETEKVHPSPTDIYVYADAIARRCMSHMMRDANAPLSLVEASEAREHNMLYGLARDLMLARLH